MNLSPLNFQNANLAAAIAEILREHDLPTEMLLLEVTEGVFLNERSGAIETMNAIRNLGAGLSLDDFGTGYSSLSRIAQLPIRELKIDRCIMRDLENDPTARAIVTTVLRVGQTLQLTVVAEGVETEGQRKLLAELGCDVVQGFLYAPAMSPQAFGRWLLDYSASRASAMLHSIGWSLSAQPNEAFFRAASEGRFARAMAADFRVLICPTGLRVENISFFQKERSMYVMLAPSRASQEGVSRSSRHVARDAKRRSNPEYSRGSSLDCFAEPVIGGTLGDPLARNDSEAA